MVYKTICQGCNGVKEHWAVVSCLLHFAVPLKLQATSPRLWPSVYIMLDQRHRQWAIVKTTSRQRLLSIVCPAVSKMTLKSFNKTEISGFLLSRYWLSRWHGKALTQWPPFLNVIVVIRLQVYACWRWPFFIGTWNIRLNFMASEFFGRRRECRFHTAGREKKWPSVWPGLRRSKRVRRPGHIG